ncbi:alpha/beta fold hydrolase [Larkinella bovis]|uniref:Alpha/beta fold hydrolase n=1 Tax=Larkinella bovis TaxID=683041 RepID=A0ABW0IEC8_9BACT
MRNKPVIVLLHGHGVNASIWDALQASLSGDYSVVKPDFSAQTHHETIEAYAEDLFSQLRAAEVQACVLVGHSMGGYIALAFAEQHPDLVRGLVLLNSTAFADTDEKKQARQKTVESLQEKGTAPFIEQTVPKMFGERFGQNRADEVQKYVSQFSTLPTEALIAGVKSIAARPDRVAVLQKATFPVLLIAGQQDQLVPFDKSQELFDQVPQAETVVLKNAGHLGVIESPEEVTKAIQDFIGKV